MRVNGLVRRIAAIIGASGLVGRYLVEMLCNDPMYTKVYAYLRAPIPFKHPNLEQIFINFDNWD